MPKVTRSAVTGQFVKKSKAKAKPKTTVSETVKRWPRKAVIAILNKYITNYPYKADQAADDLKKLLHK